VPAVPSEELLGGESRGPETPAAAARVAAARETQVARAGKLNSELDGAETKAVCQLDRTARQLVAQARSKLSLSARGVHRVMRVARTIADLDGGGSIAVVHLAEALQLRRAVSRESA
jgi:magnesium chelatase family protein